MRKVALVLASGKEEQFLPLFRTRTMLEETIDRLEGFIRKEDTWILSNQQIEESCYQAIRRAKGFEKFRFVMEPKANGTALGILYALFLMREFYGEEEDVMVHCVPSNVYLTDIPSLHKVLNEAGYVAFKYDKIVAVGVKPFEYEKDGLFWSIGHYVFLLSTMIEEYQKTMPFLYDIFTVDYERGFLNPSYALLKDTSIEKGVFEKSDKMEFVRGEFEWNNVGKTSYYENFKTVKKEGGGHGWTKEQIDKRPDS